jgi:1-acyl-sn-glycerol-3-phosphate acyltransferase
MPRWLSSLWYDVWRAFFFSAFTFGSSMRFEGGRHVPRTGPVLVVANHQSYLDPPAIGVAVPRPAYYLARKTLFRYRSFGWLLRSVHGVPVDQDGVAKEGLKTVLRLLEAGEVVIVFPEGGRSPDGTIQPLQRGIQLLIKRTQAPVVPVGIAGAWEAWPRTHLLPTPAPLFMPGCRRTLAVSIGPALDARRLATLPRQEMLAEVSRALQKQFQRAERLRRKG